MTDEKTYEPLPTFPLPSSDAFHCTRCKTDVRLVEGETYRHVLPCGCPVEPLYVDFTDYPRKGAWVVDNDGMSFLCEKGLERLPHRVKGNGLRCIEKYWRVGGSGTVAIHATREGAIEAWRDKLAPYSLHSPLYKGLYRGCLQPKSYYLHGSRYYKAQRDPFPAAGSVGMLYQHRPISYEDVADAFSEHYENPLPLIDIDPQLKTGWPEPQTFAPPPPAPRPEVAVGQLWSDDSTGAIWKVERPVHGLIGCWWCSHRTSERFLWQSFAEHNFDKMQLIHPQMSLTEKLERARQEKKDEAWRRPSGPLPQELRFELERTDNETLYGDLSLRESQIRALAGETLSAMVDSYAQQFARGRFYEIQHLREFWRKEMHTGPTIYYNVPEMLQRCEALWAFALRHAVAAMQPTTGGSPTAPGT